MKFFLSLIGLILILEGLPYATFPEAMQGWMRRLLEAPPAALRLAGLIATGAGLLLCYFAQRSGMVH